MHVDESDLADLASRLPADAETTVNHLLGCAECRERLRFLARVRQEAHAGVPVAPAVLDEVLNAIGRARVQETAPVHRISRVGIGLLAAASAFVNALSAGVAQHGPIVVAALCVIVGTLAAGPPAVLRRLT